MHSTSDRRILDYYQLPARLVRIVGKTGGSWMPKIYVGNLASSVTSRDLLEHFSWVSRAGGAISALAITDRVSGLCRGFGFVEMAEVSDVTVAFGLLNNSELNGRRIRIESEPALRNGKARKRGAAR
jgi:cold-inducible RNA-binding protein